MIPQTNSVAVVGAGAVGCYYGGLLARAGVPVTLIGRPALVDAVRRHGLLFESGGETRAIPVSASADIAAARGANYVLVCVKSADTDEVAAGLAAVLGRDAIVMSLQNGVDNAERLRARLANLVIPAVVYTAAQMSAPGHVRHTGGGSLVIGGAAQDVLTAIVAMFATARIPVQLAKDIDVELWKKLLMNCAYNAVSALAMASYAVMAASDDIRAVMRAAADEVVAVARMRGIVIDTAFLEAIFGLASMMPETISSTAQDIARGRATEIDHLNGYVVREGARLGVPVPVNRTLHALVKLRETASRR